jgi:hypothetical protein
MSKDLEEASLDAAIRAIRQGEELPNVTWIGKEKNRMGFPKGSVDAVRSLELKRILEAYAGRTSVEYPLSIAVFGPPGSGKSTLVRAMLASLDTPCAPHETLNLTQYTPKSVAERVAATLEADKSGLTKVFFFDEFDAALDKQTLGWLSWFLAPMQDSKILELKIPKAIFIFAGGIAASLTEFEERALNKPGEYREKKVPDFISRLRGFVDIQGINNRGPERPIRRALALSTMLEKRWPGLRKDRKGIFPIDEDLVRSLLSNAHYVHGFRSMEALMDMCGFDGKNADELLHTKHFPENDLKRLHVSRGPLDNRTIGISSGLEGDGAADFLQALTKDLLLSGAKLAYGGDFVPSGTLQTMFETVRDIPKELVSRSDKRIHNYLGFPSFLNPNTLPPHNDWEDVAETHNLNTLSDDEKNALGVPGKEWFSARPLSAGDSYNANRHLAWSLSLFRMRARLIQDIDALIVLGGKSTQSWGRFSGIVEEVMLALALKKPVYVLGWRSGAALTTAQLLGLGDSLVNSNFSFKNAEGLQTEDIPPNFKNCFTLPGIPPLPTEIPDVCQYLMEHSVNTPLWPWNGLQLEENRTLSDQKLPMGGWPLLASLIMKGLSRLDWTDRKASARESALVATAHSAAGTSVRK